MRLVRQRCQESLELARDPISDWHLLVTFKRPRASHAWSVRSARVCPGAPDGMPPAANGQTGRAVGPTTAAAAVHAVVEPRMPLTPNEVKNTMAFKILAQFKTPKDIR